MHALTPPQPTSKELLLISISAVGLRLLDRNLSRNQAEAASREYQDSRKSMRLGDSACLALATSNSASSLAFMWCTGSGQASYLEPFLTPNHTSNGQCAVHEFSEKVASSDSRDRLMGNVRQIYNEDTWSVLPLKSRSSQGQQPVPRSMCPLVESLHMEKIEDVS